MHETASVESIDALMAAVRLTRTSGKLLLVYANIRRVAVNSPRRHSRLTERGRYSHCTCRWE
jgi:hypothetical protein